MRDVEVVRQSRARAPPPVPRRHRRTADACPPRSRRATTYGPSARGTGVDADLGQLLAHRRAPCWRSKAERPPRWSPCTTTAAQGEGSPEHRLASRGRRCRGRFAPPSNSSAGRHRRWAPAHHVEAVRLTFVRARTSRCPRDRDRNESPRPPPRHRARSRPPALASTNERADSCASSAVKREDANLIDAQRLEPSSRCSSVPNCKGALSGASTRLDGDQRSPPWPTARGRRPARVPRRAPLMTEVQAVEDANRDHARLAPDVIVAVVPEQSSTGKPNRALVNTSGKMSSGFHFVAARAQNPHQVATFIDRRDLVGRKRLRSTRPLAHAKSSFLIVAEHHRRARGHEVPRAGEAATCPTRSIWAKSCSRSRRRST